MVACGSHAKLHWKILRDGWPVMPLVWCQCGHLRNEATLQHCLCCVRMGKNTHLVWFHQPENSMERPRAQRISPWRSPSLFLVSTPSPVSESKHWQNDYLLKHTEICTQRCPFDAFTASHFVKFLSSERRIYASDVPLADYYVQAVSLIFLPPLSPCHRQLCNLLLAARCSTSQPRCCS